jgi:hypothetical protein
VRIDLIAWVRRPPTHSEAYRSRGLSWKAAVPCRVSVLLQRILRHLALPKLLLCCAVSHAWCLPPLRASPTHTRTGPPSLLVRHPARDALRCALPVCCTPPWARYRSVAGLLAPSPMSCGCHCTRNAIGCTLNSARMHVRPRPHRDAPCGWCPTAQLETAAQREPWHERAPHACHAACHMASVVRLRLHECFTLSSRCVRLAAAMPRWRRAADSDLGGGLSSGSSSWRTLFMMRRKACLPPLPRLPACLRAHAFVRVASVRVHRKCLRIRRHPWARPALIDVKPPARPRCAALRCVALRCVAVRCGAVEWFSVQRRR